MHQFMSWMRILGYLNYRRHFNISSGSFSIFVPGATCSMIWKGKRDVLLLQSGNRVMVVGEERQNWGGWLAFQPGQWKGLKMDSVDTVHACVPLGKSSCVPMDSHALFENDCRPWLLLRAGSIPYSYLCHSLWHSATWISKYLSNGYWVINFPNPKVQ